MTSHNRRSEREKWRAVKAKVIVRFGTVKKAAQQLGCHPNSIRYAQSGLCPGVKARLEKALNE